MFKNIPTITRYLLITNIVFYVVKIVVEQKGINLNTVLGSYYPESTNFRIWQPVTHMFMHASFSHILFNMFALYLFGSSIERTIGRNKFIMLYCLSGIGAFILFNLQSAYYIGALKTAIEGFGFDPQALNEGMRLNIYGIPQLDRVPNIPQVIELCQYYITPMVGASGAIYGILAAFGMLYPNEKLMFIFLPVPVKAKYFIPGLILLEIILGLFNFSWNPVAHFAHLGGAVVGFGLVYYWLKKYRVY